MINESPSTFCKHCGQQLPSDAFFCPGCGQKTDTASDTSAPDVSGHAVPSDGGAQEKIDSGMNYAIIITVLAVFNCGSFINLALGIVAIVFASQVDQNLLAGNREKAEECAHTAKTLCMVAACVIAVQVILMLFIFFAVLTCAILPFFFG